MSLHLDLWLRSARKLSSYLVRAKLYLIERIVGSHKCKDKRCEVCLNIQETSCFSSSVTKSLRLTISLNVTRNK